MNSLNRYFYTKHDNILFTTSEAFTNNHKFTMFKRMIMTIIR